MFLRAIKLASIISFAGVVISFFLPGLLPGAESFRVTGFFNNPNQLAYFSLCSMGSILALSGKSFISDKLSLLSFSLAFLSILASASLGGIVSSIFILCAVISKFRLNFSSLIRSFALISVIFFVIVGFNNLSGNALFDRLERRSLALDRKFENLESERGYDRIMNYPAFNIFGAGEGATERFDGGLEIHSTLGTLLFSYGFIGIYLFILLLRNVMYGFNFYSFLILAAPLVYGVSHNGLRFTYFWLFLVFIYWYNSNRHSEIIMQKAIRE
jgi:hypothetical protein